MAIGQPSSHNVFLQIASEKTFMKIKNTIRGGGNTKKWMIPLRLLCVLKLIPDIRQFWDTTALLSPVKVCRLATK